MDRGGEEYIVYYFLLLCFDLRSSFFALLIIS